MARLWVIVPAAGGGSRFAADAPKQYADLAGKALIARTLDRLASLDAAAIVVALAPGDADFQRIVGERPGVEPIRCGGATRSATVRDALRALASRCRDDDWILVHDAARPCVPRAALERLTLELAGDAVGGLLATPLADTLKRAAAGDDAPRVLRTEERGDLWLAQTPQMFRYRLLAAAYEREAAVDCTDDAQAVEALAATGACAMPRLVRGSADNIKVTYPEDLALAAAILATQGVA
ncbi:MAG TPA: 2-C-methyl-D-erythritol 4-phosphate cytidylyltransferase [Casimicrobiaceae bacterium]